MTDIKFRVWDKRNGQYLNDGVDEVVETSVLNEKYELSYYEYIAYGDYGPEIDPDNFITELSTGKKDKNGTEIYEGDILGQHITDTTYEVRFGEFTYIQNEERENPQIEIITGFHYIDSEYGDIEFPYSPQHIWKVIGNVHNKGES